MIKGILASNTSKLIASCVCPVAGTVALTVGVPPVRNAVHRATAPRAYALPKTRTRQPAAAPAPVQTAMAAPPCEPVLTAGPITTPFAPEFAGVTPPDLRNFTSLPTQAVDRGPVGGGTFAGPPAVPPLPGVPEPETWLHMLVGFGVIGGVARLSLRRTGDMRVDTDA